MSDKKEFVVTHSGAYVGFHSINLKHPMKGVKYGIEFRDLLPRDRIYVNKIKYMIKQEMNANNNITRMIANAKEQTR